MKRNIFFLFLCVMAFAFTSCDHKELCYSHPHYTKVNIVFDWSDMADDEKPEGMRVAFYPIDGSTEPWMFDFPYGSNGGVVEVPANDYQVMTYNYDTDGINWENANDFFTLTATTSQTVTLDGTSATLTPSDLCSDNVTGIILSDSIESSMAYITLTPQRKVAHYTFEVNGITGRTNIYQLSASLSNMRSGLTLSGDETYEANAEYISSVSFDAARSGVQVIGSFNTFGPRLNNDGTSATANIFKLYIVDKAGRQHILEKDVTLQVRDNTTSLGTLDRHLVIDVDFSVPRDTTKTNGDGVFDVSTDEWKDINEDIIM